MNYELLDNKLLLFDVIKTRLNFMIDSWDILGIDWARKSAGRDYRYSIAWLPQHRLWLQIRKMAAIAEYFGFTYDRGRKWRHAIHLYIVNDLNRSLQVRY